MGKAKWLVFLLLWAPLARGQQCTGQYANDPMFTTLLPQDIAAQGGVTATITARVSNVASGIMSHKVTVTPGTIVHWDWESNNGSSGYVTVTDNKNSSPQTYNGTKGAGDWIIQTPQIGTTYTVTETITGSNGTTQDRGTLIVVSGNGPSIVFQDSLETNFYQQVTTTFGGSSMLASCQECQAGTTQHCINATHTPYSTIQLTNSTSGETQLIQEVQAGNVAKSNERLTGSASLAISVLPGDTGTISIDDKIVCSADGVIFEQTLPKPKTSPTGGSWFPRVTGELAFTKVALKVPTHCTPLLDPNGNVIGLHCDVAYYCSPRSSPPDYQPTGLKTYHYTNPALVPPFWMSMSPGTALVFGDGPGQIVVWYFAFPELDGVLTGVSGMDPLLLDILSPAWVSDSSTQDCTNYAKGISPWYMPKW